jgi:hypothetical protein
VAYAPFWRDRLRLHRDQAGPFVTSEAAGLAPLKETDLWPNETNSSHMKPVSPCGEMSRKQLARQDIAMVNDGVRSCPLSSA